MQDYVDSVKAQATKLMERVPGLDVQVEWEMTTDEQADDASLRFSYAVDYKGQKRGGESNLIDLGPDLAEALDKCLGPLSIPNTDILTKLRGSS
jgi:hypothetical protein